MPVFGQHWFLEMQSSSGGWTCTNMSKRYVSRFGSSVWFQVTRLNVLVGSNTWSEVVEVKERVHELSLQGCRIP